MSDVLGALVCVHSIHDISDSVGFTSDSNFSTRFTKITGAAPSEFRKANYRRE